MTNEKTEVQSFIEDAIAGGWEASIWSKEDLPLEEVHALGVADVALLDPLAWQAVGKTRGWRKTQYENGKDEWQHIWHHFIDHLADGKTIEEALAAIR